MFDTLKYAKRLESTGMSRELAEAYAEALRETIPAIAAVEMTHEAMLKLRAQVDDLGSELLKEIQALRAEVQGLTRL